MNDSNSKIHILVADDDPDILSYFRAIIKNPGHELYLVPNGVRAIEEAGKHKIDLAFLDIKMPEMGGIETLVRWKKLQPGTQIVMISTYTDEKLVREALEKGAYSYLFKPLIKMDIYAETMKSLKNTPIHNVFSFK